MTKEQFIKKMSLIQNFHSEQETLSTLINKLTNGFSVVTIGNYLITEIIDNINQDLEIEDKGLIEWWLYEDVDKVIYFKDSSFSVRSLEELYEFIIME